MTEKTKKTGRQKSKCQTDRIILQRRKRYRLFLCFLLLINIGVISAWYWKKMDDKVANHIYLYQNQQVDINWDVPLEGSLKEAQDVIAIRNAGSAEAVVKNANHAGNTINNANSAEKMKQSFQLNHPVTVTASTLGSYQAELKLFGIIPYKSIQFDVIEEAKVMPSGRAVGLYLQSDGIMVLGTSQIDGKDGFSYEPAKDILQPGDVILKVNGTAVGTIDQVAEKLQQGKEKKVKLEIRRGKNKLYLKLDKILAQDGQYKIGVWLREDTEGIGTLSFITEKNQFAALGHGIADVDTGKLISLRKGLMYLAKIEGIRKGKSGSPGELEGSVNLSSVNCIGKIESNTALGITGTIIGKDVSYREKEALPVGLKQEVKEGKAWILCQLGDTVERFEVTIEKINVNSRDNKGMVIRVTDKKLIRKTGGIVQGMSGSPIMQNGKVIGAITHVFVNEPTKGYGTFIENMLGE
ncbi:MAG: SpoIVB peptidase [Butyribacter sp.]|nr:SpoIVB peptidase [bacterium]MDY3854352.1 SpoIVB peptidase [Butyribacter sp.]